MRGGIEVAGILDSAKICSVGVFAEVGTIRLGVTDGRLEVVGTKRSGELIGNEGISAEGISGGGEKSEMIFGKTVVVELTRKCLNGK